ncbi:hypothetical protein TSUD_59920 [Trifolium subterraneum]|uniref:DUF223 domain-containing protein n=1 Tax=Trifolium subterraneum TaxID=3900 RepID=A0A2Z6N5A5_TRISU|nr:hypothetical protein TSUD_59920 [Trifolium subterraneum]
MKISNMDPTFDALSSVVVGRDSWRFKVRVVRMWTVSSFLKLDQVNSIEMVLIDDKGVKIHATVRRQLLYLFQNKFVEGQVYKMSYFSVTPSVGGYRTTTHPYKLLFQMKTKVLSYDSAVIPLYGLSLSSVSEVCSHVVDYDNLVGGLELNGIECSPVVPVLGPRVRPSMEDEFLRLYPKKTISQLLDLPEDGTFVVSAIVDGLVDGEDWWYPSCKCHRSVTPDSGAYYCKGCDKHVFHMLPRYKVKLMVSDSTASAVFVVFYGDVQYLIHKQCYELVSASKAENAGFYPSEISLLAGVKMLFKIEISPAGFPQFDGTFRVKRVCADSAIVELFLLEELECNSTKDGSNGGGSEEIGVGHDQDCVQDTQEYDFISDLIVLPTVADGVVKEIGNSSASAVVNLGDGDDPGLDVLLSSELKRKRKRTLASIKKNLGPVFAECDDKEDGLRAKG